jgi:serine/threonine protein kinase
MDRPIYLNIYYYLNVYKIYISIAILMEADIFNESVESDSIVGQDSPKIFFDESVCIESNSYKNSYISELFRSDIPSIVFSSISSCSNPNQNSNSNQNPYVCKKRKFEKPNIIPNNKNIRYIKNDSIIINKILLYKKYENNKKISHKSHKFSISNNIIKHLVKVINSNYEQQCLEVKYDKASNASNYKIHNKIGNGAFGEILFCEWCPTESNKNHPIGAVSRMSNPDTHLVIDNKQISRDNLFVCKSSKNKSQKSYEETILSNCAYPSICGYIDTFCKNNNTYIVLEYINGNDLKNIIQNKISNNTYFSQEEILNIFVQLLMAVEYLHRNNILHRDIKPANIMISNVGQLKLCDFGFSKQCEYDVDTTQLTQTILGTPAYMSPEIIQNVGYNSKSDMWSIGIILFQLVFLQKPFDYYTTENFFDNMVFDDINSIVKNNIYVSNLHDIYDSIFIYNITGIIQKLLDKNQKKRISAKNCLNIPFVKHAMKSYVNEYENTITDKQKYDANIDHIWLEVLKEHYNLIVNNDLSSQKSALNEKMKRDVDIILRQKNS